MNITKSIKFYWLNIQEKVMCLISTIGLKRELKKKKRIEKKLNKAISKFNFSLNVHERTDTLVVLDGQLIRVLFSVNGFIIRDDLNDEPITDRLTILKVMERISK
ncbi:hypothetical protein ACOIYK_001866 [Vibrio parahaemolyticus]